MNSPDDLVHFISNLFLQLKVIYKKNDQGIYSLNTLLIIIFIVLFLLPMILFTYWQYLLQTSNQLNEDIVQLQRQLTKEQAIAEQQIRQQQNNNDDFQSIISYLLIKNIVLENVTFNDSNEQKIWRISGQLAKDNLTTFIINADKDSQVLNLTDIDIEQINDKPGKLRLSLSGQLESK